DEQQPEVNAAPLNATLVEGNKFTDKTFKFGDNYRYFVRAVSLGTEGAQVESVNSNLIPIAPRDKFPPSAPGPVTLNASPGRISMFFPANPEPDVAGYFIWRSTDANLPHDKWTKLNREPLTRTT